MGLIPWYNALDQSACQVHKCKSPSTASILIKRVISCHQCRWNSSSSWSDMWCSLSRAQYLNPLWRPQAEARRASHHDSTSMRRSLISLNVLAWCVSPILTSAWVTLYPLELTNNSNWSKSDFVVVRCVWIFRTTF